MSLIEREAIEGGAHIGQFIIEGVRIEGGVHAG